MADLRTKYLGLDLAHPIMPGAGPLADDLDNVRRLEDAGAPAIVMRSLFEEQIVLEREAVAHHIDAHTEASPEALSYMPPAGDFAMGPERYLEQIQKIRAAVKVPVIASLNGVTASGWLEYARLIQQAGAHALELNVYYVATDLEERSDKVEQRTLDIVREVKRAVTIPLAVKLSPFFSSLAHFASSLDVAHVDGLVMFNRFYQPDIDPEALELRSTLHLSNSSELLLRLHWLAILSGRVRTSLACSGGVHTGLDVVKSVMAGANAVQTTSALLQHGPGYLATLRREFEEWMDAHEFESVKQMCGNMNLLRSPNPAALERGNYMRVLQSWHPSPSVRAGR